MAYLKRNLKKSPYWYIIDGRRSLSTKKRDKRAVGEILREYNGELVRGKLRLGGRKSTLTVSELLNKILADYEAVNLKAETLKLYGYAFGTWIELIGDINISDITTNLVQGFMMQCRKNIMPNSVNIYYRTLRAAFNRAVKWEDIDANPFSEVKQLSESNPKPRRAILAHEWQKLMVVIDDERFKAFLRIAVMTGGRRGEMLALRDTDFDSEMSNGTFSHDTKHDKTRGIPINPTVRDLLRQFKPQPPDGRIFPWNASWVSHRFTHYRILAGLPEGITFHSLRHTFATTLLSKGVDIYTVSELLGHSSIKVTEEYLHSIPEVRNNAVNMLKF